MRISTNLFYLRDQFQSLLIASFPSTIPPDETPFQCYYVDKKSAETQNEVDFMEQNILIAGEGKRVEFVTTDVPAEHGAGTRQVNSLLLQIATDYFQLSGWYSFEVRENHHCP